MREENGRIILESIEDCFEANDDLHSVLFSPPPYSEEACKKNIIAFFTKLAKYEDYPYETEEDSSYLQGVLRFLFRFATEYENGQYEYAFGDLIDGPRLSFLVTWYKAMLLETGRKVLKDDFPKQQN
ncbi:MAG: hypothetical protein IJ571_00565 [Ruminococcus sp.]|nr:hypothetical protein [Ruminococcus sp.]